MVRKKNTNEKKLHVKVKKGRDTLVEQPATSPAWNPFDIMPSMERLFSDYPWMPAWWRRWRMTPSGYGGYINADTKVAPLDLVDMGNQYKIVAEMPGVSKEDLDVHITPTGINICGEAKTEIEEEHEGYLRRERNYSTLCRNMPFPEEVNPEKAEATLKEGILEITVAKKTPMKPKGRTISVK